MTPEIPVAQKIPISVLKPNLVVEKNIYSEVNGPFEEKKSEISALAFEISDSIKATRNKKYTYNSY